MALPQMRERDHAEKYRGHDGPVHPIGVAGGREARNLLDIRTGHA